MQEINWQAEVEKRKEELLQDLQSLIAIKSVLDEKRGTPDAPLGEQVKEALDFMLNLGQKDGFTEKNVDNLAGHVEFGTGEELVGILCHVDVVPEGDGWTTDPFGGEIKDGKIFGRGAIDDKGPTMAAYYAMKIVKELGLPLHKRVRMIIGTDEESEWRCVDRYFEKEEMPAVGFAPDADFPIIFAEKGIADFDVVQQSDELTQGRSGDIIVHSFEAGRRYNMVPDYAKAAVTVNRGQTEVIQSYRAFVDEHGLDDRSYIDNGRLILELKGVSAHGMEPDLGKNAGLYLAEFLAGRELDKKAAHFFQFTSRFFFEESRGRKLGIDYSDKITGDLTINVGKLAFHEDTGGRLGLNMRYPVTFQLEEQKALLTERLAEERFKIENFSDSPPHHVDQNHPFIQTLCKVYEEQTGEKAELLSIGGGTYARSLKTGVAFGALFPGREDVAHQKDEYMFIEDLLKATAIYAQTIWELAGEK
ncbi:dipeptidase PepV [Bacillus sp. FJAT-27231]|uniref:dipeptidase PepV n=1 Tax=Bacillus sp. FJAT-27231 TaxID=1679168 RepID=UPI00067166E4|nr:dipeptidase PepV [Bacillus sp. FJAT-27231]KMY55099.1 dipeptidase PepV [Bacillus sp. FJAT-27231]